MLLTLRSLVPGSLVLLTACSGGGEDPAATPAGFPSAVEVAKAKAAEGDPLGAVEAYKALWKTHPEDVGRPAAYKITLSVFDAVWGAPVPPKERVEPLIDLLHWAAAKHPAKAAEFAAREESVLALGVSDEQRDKLKSNPYLGG